MAGIEVARPDGTVIDRRELEARGKSCRELDEAVEEVIAVALYPGSRLDRPRVLARAFTTAPRP